MKFTYERAGKVVVGMIMFCLSAFILVMMALSDGQYIQKAFGMSENSIFYSFFARIQNARTGQTEVEYLGMPLAMLVYKVLSFAMPSYLIGLPVEAHSSPRCFLYLLPRPFSFPDTHHGFSG